MKAHVVSMLAAGAVALGVFAVGMNDGNSAEAGQEAKTGDMELLFVQNAGSGSFEGTTLSLHGVGPTI